MDLVAQSFGTSRSQEVSAPAEMASWWKFSYVLVHGFFSFYPNFLLKYALKTAR